MKSLSAILIALALGACGTNILPAPGNPQEPNGPASASASDPDDGRGDNGGDAAQRLLTVE